MSIEIKKGVPPPEPRGAGGRPSIYKFDDMKPGDFSDVLPNKGETMAKCAKRVRTAASSWRQRNAPNPRLSFIVRDTDDFGFQLKDELDRPCVRIWAVAPEDSLSPKNRAKLKQQSE